MATGFLDPPHDMIQWRRLSSVAVRNNVFSFYRRWTAKVINLTPYTVPCFGVKHCLVGTGHSTGNQAKQKVKLIFFSQEAFQNLVQWSLIRALRSKQLPSFANQSLIMAPAFAYNDIS